MHMEAIVYALKEVPIDVSVTGEPAEGYLATGTVGCDPPTVMLASTVSALADISKVSVTIDITGESEDEERTINLRPYLDNSLRFADSNFNGRVNAIVHIEPKADRMLTVSSRNVAVQNLPEGFELEFAEGQSNYRLRISGLNNAVAAVEQNAVMGTLDISAWMQEHGMTELREGSYEIPVAFEVPRDVTIENEIFARVTISKVNEEDIE